jgi:hypothetical protein
MLDWHSKTKYEGTYVGHNFVFRLAKDERIVVDSVSLHPTRVIDCPGLKNQVNVASVVEAQAIITPIMLGNKDMLNGDMMLSHIMLKNLNATVTMNATEWVMHAPTDSRRRRRARSDSHVVTHSA